VAEPVCQRRGKIPAIGGLLRRVGCGDDRDTVRQRKVTDDAFQHHP
jgi:hypothetical protein